MFDKLGSMLPRCNLSIQKEHYQIEQYLTPRYQFPSKNICSIYTSNGSFFSTTKKSHQLVFNTTKQKKPLRVEVASNLDNLSGRQNKNKRD